VTDYHKLNDDELLDLLFTEEDHLPRAAVDEFVRRGEIMVKPLSKIASYQYYWTIDGPEWWSVVHAVFILGAIGSKDTVLPLLKAMRWAVAFDCDWITEELPSIFGKTDIEAVDGLKKVATDKTTDWYTRTLAINGLAASTIDNPKFSEDMFPFIYTIMQDEDEEREVRQAAADTLFDFLRVEYKDDLILFGKEEKALSENDTGYMASFFDDEVEEEFSKRKMDLWCYTRDWLSFYSKDKINYRQKRREEERKRELEKKRLHLAEEPFVHNTPKIGRNDPCPCGSGKKYKKCCMDKTTLH